MYTRCPKCRTTFAVSNQQLEARGGVVRCGECHHVFRADKYLMNSIPRARTAAPESEGITSETAHVLPEKKSVGFGPNSLPTLEELLWGKKRSRIKPFFWGLGNALVFIVLTVQVTYFFSTELGRNPDLRPHVQRLCKYLGCIIQPQIDAGLIELVKTRVSPHPGFANVLRLRATLINRASFSQAYPLMEVSLSNRNGEILGRRSYGPQEYLGDKKNLSQNMLPNVIVHAKLEITSPNRRADGFEIRLIADPQVLATH